MRALWQSILEYGGGSGDFRIGMYYTWKPTRLETYHIGQDLITPGPPASDAASHSAGRRLQGCYQILMPASDGSSGQSA